jgi:hypothetical protein
MESHEKRHRLVAEGEMTPEEARKKQTKAWIQDAAAVGIAALGIKGAFSEWKEMNEQRYDFRANSPRRCNKLTILIIDVRFRSSRSVRELAERSAWLDKSKRRWRGMSA